MTRKRKTNVITSDKPQNDMTTDCESVSKISKVKLCTEPTKGSNYFANIKHKHSSGSDNWKKFMELEYCKQNNKEEKRNHFKKTEHMSRPTIKHQQSGGPMIPKIISIDLVSEPVSSYVTKNNNNNRNNSEFHDLKHNNKFKEESLANTFSKKQRSGPNGKMNRPKSITQFKGVNKPLLTKQIAMDCEMVGVEIGVKKSMVARVSLVNALGDCIYDKYVKPTEPVLDYRTFVSGIRPKDLENAAEFKVVQQEVADMLKGRILVGHAISNDLSVLFLTHPKHSIRDTAKFSKLRHGKSLALKKLAQIYLGVTIQKGEHDSVQDALATMQIYRLFRKEWEEIIHNKGSKKNSLVKKVKPSNLSITAMDV